MIDVMTIVAGTRLKLANASVAEVVENMHDGQWLMIRYVAAQDESIAGEEELVHASDVVGLDAS